MKTRESLMKVKDTRTLGQCVVDLSLNNTIKIFFQVLMKFIFGQKLRLEIFAEKMLNTFFTPLEILPIHYMPKKL